MAKKKTAKKKKTSAKKKVAARKKVTTKTKVAPKKAKKTAKKKTAAKKKAPGKKAAPVSRKVTTAAKKKKADKKAAEPKKAVEKVKATPATAAKDAATGAKPARGAKPSKSSKAPKRPELEDFEMEDIGDRDEFLDEDFEAEFSDEDFEDEEEDFDEEDVEGQDEETLQAGDAEPGAEEEVILTDAEGRRLCKVPSCDQVAAVEGYCRYHYLLFWKRIQVRKKILSEGKLDKYIEELTSRYPMKYLELLRKDLRTQQEFLHAVQELEIDESSVDNEYEDEAQSFIEEVRGMSGGSSSEAEADDEF